MKKILILFAHPAFQKSRINKILIQGLDDIEGITLHDLYQAYPEMDIDIESEQRLVDAHDIVIFHHPFYWYSTPAILKEWQDLVLKHGWAYGHEGKNLKGKFIFQVLTAGGERMAYCQQGYNKFTIRQLLSPFEQMANLCKMNYLPPFVVHGTHSITMQEVLEHKTTYLELLAGLRDETINLDDLANREYFNDYFTQK
ncbi:NAD(P)H-dependent oxidoreductase [Labilibaculum antarcticum]|uniref:NAD(P)H oxidoreductase n=1 Tax=Labilibaculum antarcticum TaxID=1717717 RepID=A0A1Y1CNU4_9BACT|nr:NAD(P)H-dependent oxidoreductase [Labilibaculum antarcticum]BAX81683.1 NAD(P)H oxidoreductase [Labilibaculum antarcticum]